MSGISKPIQLTGYIMTGIGVILFGANVILGWTLNIALPLVFLVLGTGFLILGSYWERRWKWATFLNIPGTLLIAFGIIFLLNVLTGDWNSWAYAWLLLVAGIGAGLILANRDNSLHPVITLTGWGMTAAGITFFVVFGAIAGGAFIQVMAPILIVLAGFLLIKAPLVSILPESLVKRLHLSSPVTGGTSPAGEQSPLIEPLSSREIEVLQLIDKGFSNQQIADQLSIAASTVKTHINNIYGKLDVQTRIQAVNRARDLDIIKIH